MAEPPFALKREEFLAYVQIESMRGKNALEIINAIREADPECSFAYSTIARWTQDFKNGREDISQRHLSGRHATIMDGFYIEKLRSY